MLRAMLVAALCAASVIGATPASAAMMCGDRTKMISHLGKKYEEARSGIGLAASGSVVELYTAKTGTWTILITDPAGKTCVIGSGESWESEAHPTPTAGEIS